MNYRLSIILLKIFCNALLHPKRQKRKHKTSGSGRYFNKWLIPCTWCSILGKEKPRP